MIPFATTPEQAQKIPGIARNMELSGMDAAWVSDAATLAQIDQGVFDLMEFWEMDHDDDWLRDISAALVDYGSSRFAFPRCKMRLDRVKSFK